MRESEQRERANGVGAGQSSTEDRGRIAASDCDGTRSEPSSADWAASQGVAIRLLVRPCDYVFPGAPIALVSRLTRAPPPQWATRRRSVPRGSAPTTLPTPCVSWSRWPCVRSPRESTTRTRDERVRSAGLVALCARTRIPAKRHPPAQRNHRACRTVHRLRRARGRDAPHDHAKRGRQRRRPHSHARGPWRGGEWRARPATHERAAASRRPGARRMPAAMSRHTSPGRASHAPRRVRTIKVGDDPVLRTSRPRLRRASRPIVEFPGQGMPDRALAIWLR